MIKKTSNIYSRESIIDLSLENIHSQIRFHREYQVQPACIWQGYKKKAQTPGEINKANVIRFPKNPF